MNVTPVNNNMAFGLNLSKKAEITLQSFNKSGCLNNAISTITNHNDRYLLEGVSVQKRGIVGSAFMAPIIDHAVMKITDTKDGTNLYCDTKLEGLPTYLTNLVKKSLFSSKTKLDKMFQDERYMYSLVAKHAKQNKNT